MCSWDCMRLRAYMYLYMCLLVRTYILLLVFATVRGRVEESQTVYKISVGVDAEPTGNEYVFDVTSAAITL